ncbi:MAG: hypothetical protein JO154_01385 [Chitinophaga sp.]|uniref:hypothetical protein n=1 Tax=Chitinophaga sp. TaxID=1869181 RepID=UPI0025C21288|nr:hypothetical protein [Chitinophaga sp.]MBV8251230.1 hypothetical protein [Chitinophaga sp.]
MNKRYLLILLAAMLASCHPKTEKKEKATVDITSFTAFVQSLELVKIPYTYKSSLDPIIALHTIEDSLTIYDQLWAGRLKTNNNVVSVFYYGVRNGHTNYWVTTYAGDGSKLDQVQIGEVINEHGQMGHYATKVVMENDSIIEFRKYFVEYTGNFFKSGPEKPSEIHFFAVQPDGKLLPKNVVKESFQTYLAAFQQLTLPLRYASTTEQKNFYQLLRGSSWFDFGGLFQSNFPSLYMVGKIEVPEKQPMVLLKVEDLDGGEDADAFGPAMVLIAYTPQGKETDRMEVTGNYAGESYQFATHQFNMDTDGSISMMETTSLLDSIDGYTAIHDERAVKCILSPTGHFTRTYTAVKMEVQDFDPAKLRSFKEGATTYDDLDYLGSLEDWNLTVLLHTSVEKTGKVIRLITASNSGGVRGAVVLSNTTRNEGVKALESIGNDYVGRQELKGTINGPVTVTIGGKTYLVAKDGSITVQ